MVQLFSQEWKKNDLLRRIGDISQCAGITPVILDDGPQRGVRALQVRTGSGLVFRVLPDRGLDIDLADYRGLPIAWRSPTGTTSPAFFNPEGTNWLRSFFGGLLTTCGMTYLGAPCKDGEESLGLHGRFSNLPASNIQVTEDWNEEEYLLCIKGRIRESCVFGENLAASRTIMTQAGSNAFTISDTIVNQAYQTTPCMILYHVNIGFPLLSEDSFMLTSPAKTVPRDTDAQQGMEHWRTFDSPQQDYREQVFFHALTPDDHGMVSAAIINPKLHFGLALEFPQASLPHFIQWKMLGEGLYVVGMEPANTCVRGRNIERREGNVVMLEPGQSLETFVSFEVLTDHAAIEKLRQRLAP